MFTLSNIRKNEAKQNSDFTIVTRDGVVFRPSHYQYKSFKVHFSFDRRKESGEMHTQQACSRCGGEGGWKGWPNWTCYRCGGCGTDPKQLVLKVYTRRKQQKLEAAQIKRNETKRLKEQAKIDAVLNVLRTDPLFVRTESVDRSNEYNGFIVDVAAKWVKFGSISEAQRTALTKALDKHDEFKARKEAEIASNVAAPEGRVVLQGEIVKFKTVPGFGYNQTTIKMLVECEGFKVWGTVPAALDDSKVGDKVEFTATVERSRDNESFAFFKRPTKARVL